MVIQVFKVLEAKSMNIPYTEANIPLFSFYQNIISVQKKSKKSQKKVQKLGTQLSFIKLIDECKVKYITVSLVMLKTLL